MGSGASKVAFREVVQEVGEKDISGDDKAFWNKLWRTESNPQDVFEVISPTAIRRLKAERIGNLEALLRNAVSHLEEVLERPEPSKLQGAMTAVSVLTRVMPFLLEGYIDAETGAVDVDLERLFWSTEASPEKEGGDDHDEGVNKEHDEGAEDDEAAVEPVSLGSALVSVAMRMLFVHQLTVDALSSCSSSETADKMNPLEIQDPTLLWSGALDVGKEANIQGGRDLEARRIEVMRLILVLMCEPLFQRNVDFDPCSSRFAQEVCKADVPHASELFFSLLGVIVTFDPVGWGMPYVGSFSSDLPVRQLDMSAQLLAVLLDFGKPPLPVVTNPLPASENGEELRQVMSVREDAPSPGERGYNVFRNLVLHGLKDEEDFGTVYAGISRLLNNLHLSHSAYIPGSGVTVNCYQEVLVLLWKLMEENPVFSQYVLKHCDVNEILVPVCYLLVENRKDVSKGGLIHICTFLLLKLSGERQFGVAINKPCTVRLPTDLPLFSGTHLDLLILTVHKLLVAGSERLSPLYHCLLTVLCNMSPYCKSMCLVASVKLVNLFELFTSPGNLYASETNKTYVSLLLEMFSNIIQYQYTGNAHLMYAIVRRQEAFESLYELDLPSAIAAAQKFAKSGGTRSATRKARKAGGGGGVEGGNSGQSSPAIGLKAGPEEKDSRVSASDAVLQQYSGPARGAGKEVTVPSSPVKAGESESEHGTAEQEVLLRFRPTQEWLENVRSEVPFSTIIRLLRNLGPQVEEMCMTANALDESTMVEFVSNTTMVGLLPVPHPIVIRKYQPNQHTAIWFTAFMWGVVFIRNQDLPMFDGKKIRLFTVSTA